MAGFEPKATAFFACPIGRRAALKAALGASLGLAPLGARAEGEIAQARPQEGDLLVRFGEEPRPLRVDDVARTAAPIMAWPMEPATKTVRDGSRLNKVLVLRLEPDGLEAATRERAADGVLAYSAVCPHTGCDVTGWQADRSVLVCPCHYSQYDPKDSAKVVAGPSPRRLAALPLRNDDGRLVVAKPFAGRVGIQQT